MPTFDTDRNYVDHLEGIEGLFAPFRDQVTLITHEPVDGSAGGSSVTTNTDPAQGAKALIMISKGTQPVLAVLRGPDRANMKALKQLIGTKDLRFSTPEEAYGITHTEIGTIPAIGSLFGIPTYVDTLLLQEDQIVCGTGLRTQSLVMPPSIYRQVVNPIEGQFSDAHK